MFKQPNLKLLSLAVIAIFGFLYISMVPHRPVGLHQSDWLLAHVPQGGLLDSPGFPFVSLWLYLQSNLLGTQFSPAFWGHSLAIISSLLILTLVATWSQQLYLDFNRDRRFVWFENKWWHSGLLIGLVVASLALANHFWRYSLFVQPYIFSSLTLFLLVWSGYQLWRGKQVDSWLWVWAICAGLSLWQTFVTVPVLLVQLWLLKGNIAQTKPQAWIRSLIGFTLIVALGGGILLWFGQNQVELSPQLQANNLLEFVEENYWQEPEEFDFETFINHSFNLINIITQSFGILLYPLVAIVLFTPKGGQKNPLKYLLGVSLIIFLSLVIGYDWQPDLDQFPESIPHSLLLHPPFAILLWFSWYELTTRIGGALATLTASKHKASIILTSLVLLPVGLGIARFSFVDLRPKLYLDEMSREILAEVEPESLVVCFSYPSCHSIYYQQRINQLNPDLEVIPFYYQPQRLHNDWQDLQSFDYQEFPYVIHDIVTTNRYQQPIYAVDMFQNYFEVFGVDYGFIFYVPLGYHAQLANQIPEPLPEIDTQVSDELLKTELASWDYPMEKSKLEMAHRHLQNTIIYIRSGDRVEGASQANFATNLGYDLRPESAEEIARIRGNLEGMPVNQFYLPGTEQDDIDTILESVSELLENRRFNRARRISWGALTIDPFNIQARLDYAYTLESLESSQSAITEYQNVLQLDPENQRALERLEYQNNLLN